MTATSNWQPTACMLCFNNCGLKVQVGDGHILKVRGDKENPISGGYVCEKAQQLDYYQNSADRLETPLRRNEDGSYQAIDWDTALSEIAAKLLAIRESYGGESFISCGGGQANHLSGGYSGALQVAMTETARHAHYVLPAATQFEKWECSMLYLRSTFPRNTFHLRAPVLPSRPNVLDEPGIPGRDVLLASHCSMRYSAADPGLY